MFFDKIKQYIALQKRKRQNQKFFSDEISTINTTQTAEIKPKTEQSHTSSKNLYHYTKTRLPSNKSLKKQVSQISMLTAGSVLSTRRKELRLSIKQIASETKIQEKYLQNIENNQFQDFESAVFLNGFIKIYADYLDLDVQKVSALFRRQIKRSETSKQALVKNNQNKLSNLLTPNNLIITMAILFLLLVGGYISIQFANFKKAPYLEITSPTNQTNSETKTFELKGITEEATSIYINETEVNVDEFFQFSTIINLREGSNTITIKAIKKSNQQNISKKTLSINYNSQPNDLQESPIIPDSYSVKVETVNAEVWLQLTVDGKQELAQILANNQSKEFTFKDEINLSTGRPSSTKLYINEEPIELNIDFTTGTGKITCSIKRDGYSCH